jgi:acetyl-CoA acetyltransferase
MGGERPDWGHSTDLDDVSGRAAIAGVGESAYTKASGRTAREIGAEAAERAIADAGLEPSDIDGLTWNRAFADFDAAAFHEHFGTSHDLWTSQWGGGMTWAGTAPHLAAKAIEAGKATHVLNVFAVAWATQRGSMTGGPGETHAAQPLKQNLEVPFGFFPQPVYFATIMRRHMLEFGTTEEQFGAIAVASRRHANLNPEAVMHDKKMTLEDYLVSPVLADPLRMFDSCLISDGGAAFVTTSIDRARDLRQPPAVVAGVGEGTATSGGHWSQQPAFTSTPQVFAAPPAFKMAGLDPADVDVLTVYDPFTVVSMMQIEDMGFCPKGEAGVLAEEGGLAHDSGRLAFNTHGGLLSHAYVLGIAHVVEVVKQLRGTASAQVPGCEVGVYGGYTGGNASTLILRTDR